MKRTTTNDKDRPLPVEPPPGRLVRRGRLLVMPSRGRTITLEETNAAIEESRNERCDPTIPFDAK